MASESVNNPVLPSISKLYLGTEIADVKFMLTSDDDTKMVPAHKVILAAASPVFSAMFYGKLKEKEKVEIAEVTINGFEEFLQFFYLDNVQLTMENMEEVARLADKYDMVERLNIYASNQIDRLTMDNICWGYQLAIIIKHEQLKAFCEKHICAFPDDFFKSDTFQQCDRETLKHVLELETMMYDETDIFVACLAWAKFNCDQNGIDNTKAANLREQLGDCFNLIRFGAMTHEDFVTHTVAYEELFTRDELAYILYKTNEDMPKKFIQNPRSNTFLQWNNTQMLVCSQDVLTTNPAYSIQSPESVWFSTSVPVVLGEIYCVPMINSNGYWCNGDVCFNVTIVEINAQSFDVSASTKIMFNGTVAFVGDSKEIKVPFTQPVPINPTKMYEIRLDTATNVSGYYCHGLQWKSDVKLDEKIAVKFHRNPSNSERRGLVSRLCFNQL